MTKKTPGRTPDTRDRLLDSAERLFASHGFDGTSVRAITDAARANLGAINYYFRSKEGLYTEVFSRRATLLREPVTAAARKAGLLARDSPEAAFRTLGRAILAPHGHRDARPLLHGLFARETIEARLPPGLLVREFLVPVIETIETIVRQTRPTLSEGSARACAYSFLAQLMGIVRGARHGTTPEDEQLDHAVRFTVAAVRHMEDAPPRRVRR